MTGGGRPATEWLWCNFPPPVTLHDYRYLGAGFRERERIKRKKQRWTDRLHRLPMLERRALLAAIEEAWPDPASPKVTMRPAARQIWRYQPPSPFLARPCNRECRCRSPRNAY